LYQAKRNGGARWRYIRGRFSRQQVNSKHVQQFENCVTIVLFDVAIVLFYVTSVLFYVTVMLFTVTIVLPTRRTRQSERA
jgi:Flp pilus assembly protein TadB